MYPQFRFNNNNRTLQPPPTAIYRFPSQFYNTGVQPVGQFNTPHFGGQFNGSTIGGINNGQPSGEPFGRQLGEPVAWGQPAGPSGISGQLASSSNNFGGQFVNGFGAVGGGQFMGGFGTVGGGGVSASGYGPNFLAPSPTYSEIGSSGQVPHTPFFNTKCF